MSGSDDILSSDIFAIAAANAEFLDAMAIQLPLGGDRDLFQEWADANRKLSREHKSWTDKNFNPSIQCSTNIVEAYKETSVLTPIECKSKHIPDIDESKVPNLGLFG